MFRNAFGYLETFHCFGATLTELKPTRSTAMFGGKTRNYRVLAVPEHTSHTGIIPSHMVPLFADLWALRLLRSCLLSVRFALRIVILRFLMTYTRHYRQRSLGVRRTEVHSMNRRSLSARLIIPLITPSTNETEVYTQKRRYSATGG